MREIQIDEFGPPSVLHLVPDAPDPQPGPEDLLLRVAYAGMNPLDYKMRDGSSPRAAELTLPAVLGREGVGEVIGAGSDVDLETIGLAHGARVFGVRDLEDLRGMYAEVVAVRATDVAPVPPSVPAQDLPEFGGLALTGCTALTILEDDAKLEPGQSVLVLGGTGGVGQMLIPLALEAGASLVLATGRAENAERIRELGAEPIPYDEGDWRQAVLEATGGRGVDVVIDTHYFGTFLPALDLVAEGGCIVAVPSLADVTPATERGITAHVTRMRPTRARLDHLAEATAQGRLHVEVSAVLPLEDAARGQEILEDGHTRGKLVLDAQA